MYQYELPAQCGIIFEGERGELVAAVSGRLHELRLLRVKTDIVNRELINSLNEWRRSVGLPECDYLEPRSIYGLTGLESSGDELLRLASSAEDACKSELDRLEFCRSSYRLAASFGLTLGEYLDERRAAVEAMPSPESLKCALLASLLER